MLSILRSLCLVSLAPLFPMLASLAPLTASGQSPTAATPIDFARDIQPILAARCYDCHGLENPKAGLRLTSLQDALTGGESGDPALIPRNSASSTLIQRLLTEDENDVMPQKADRLPAGEISLLQRWIDEGALWPENQKHWAYIKPVRPALPELADATRVVRNPIDRFVLARLEKQGLAPSPDAGRARWLRRVSLDLVGLPPTPETLAAFLADPGDAAYERVVDRLLASPQYGERWARPWLDLARYADSHGFQRDDLRDIWPYRDWVIRALNADMPFDQFTIWQIAGDLLPKQGAAGTPAQLDPLIATGFHRAAPTNVEAGTDQEEGRINQVFDRINTTAAVWLGSTLECAQCHNHKYDPFTQKEYYQLFDFFNHTVQETQFASAQALATLKFVGPYLEMPDPAQESARPALQAQAAALDASIRELTERLLAGYGEWEQAAALRTPPDAATPPGNIAAALRAPASERTRAQTTQLRNYYLNQDETLKDLNRRKTKLAADLNALKGPQTLVMQDIDSRRPTALLNRGSFLDPGEPVQPGTPAVLHPLTMASSSTAADARPPSRLDLARWLVDAENPLVARVTVNRWWAEFFGRGIVSTLEDFGIKGEAPTHPELLDWLAVEFMERGWSMKHIHKLIVLSATYRQSSHVTPELLARDDQNKTYARGPRFRLDAETIRDNALAAAGLLSLKQGGPPVRPYQPPGLWESKVGGDRVTYEVSTGEDAWRRGVYTVWKRSSPYPSFVNFDATARIACTVQRSRSNTPLQALTLLNDPVYVEAAMALAKRTLTERANASADERIRYAFQLCLTREPTVAETRILRTLLEQQLATQAAKATVPAPVSLTGKFTLPPQISAAEFAAWQAVAAALLNLDEMITKG